jgi:MFS family permease
MTKNIRPSGLFGFTLVWAGQLLSLLGSRMTLFALTYWAWRVTGQATTLSLLVFFSFTPTVLLSLVAGPIVDRWNRKWIMVLSDAAAFLSTTIVLLLYVTGRLQMWHLYATGAFSGAFQAFQFPAYSAAVTTMVPEEHYTRANGMLGLAGNAARVFGPLAAGFLLPLVSIAGILIADIVTFGIAIGTLLAVHIPQPETETPPRPFRKWQDIWEEMSYGFRYILQRPSLLGLQLILLADNLIASFSVTVLPAMILARTGNNQQVLGSVQAAMGLGGLTGSLLLTAWGGPRRRVLGVLLGVSLSNLAGSLVIGLGDSLPVWAMGGFFYFLFVPIISGSNRSLWQSGVPAGVQGRVFAAQWFLLQASGPPATLLAGTAADYVFEPLMRRGGYLEGLLGGLVGTGPGAGIALMFVLTGILGALIGVGGYAFPAIREAEERLAGNGQDHRPHRMGGALTYGNGELHES